MVTFLREAQLSTTIDKESRDRTIRLSASSEVPVLRSLYGVPWIEILGHTEAEADLGRLNNGAPVLYGHNAQDRDNHIGVVKRAWIEDGRLMADVQISDRDGFVDGIYRDIETGVLSNVSIGYNVDIDSRELLRSANESDSGFDEFRVRRWEPSEISFVGIPADHSVGVGRNLNNDQGKKMATVAETLRAAVEVTARADGTTPETVVAAVARAAERDPAAIDMILNGTVKPTPEAVVAFRAITGADVPADVEGDEPEAEPETETEDAADAADTENDSPEDDADDVETSETEDNETDETMSEENRTAQDSAAMERAKRAIARRNTELTEAFRPHLESEGVRGLFDTLIADVDVTSSAAKDQLLAHLGRSTDPIQDDRTDSAAGGRSLSIQGGEDHRDKRGIVIADAMYNAMRVEAPENIQGRVKGDNELREMNMVGLARECLRAHGLETRGSDMEIIERAMKHTKSAPLAGGRQMTTCDFSWLTQDSCNKIITEAFDRCPPFWDCFAKKLSLDNCQPHYTGEIGSTGGLQHVPEGGEIEYKALCDITGEPIKLELYACMMAISYHALCNNDIESVWNQASDIGEDTAEFWNDQALMAFLTNPTMADEVNLYDFEGHMNDNVNKKKKPTFGPGLPAGAAEPDCMSFRDAIMSMSIGMSRQKRFDGKFAKPKLNCILGEDCYLEEFCEVLDRQYEGEGGNKSIVGKLGLQFHTDPRITEANERNGTPGAIYGFADPMRQPAVRLACLNGQTTPTVDYRDGWNIPGQEIRVMMWGAAKAVRYQSTQRNTVIDWEKCNTRKCKEGE